MALIPYVMALVMLMPKLIHQAVLPALLAGDGSDTRHARLIMLRAGWKSLNQIWLMQHFSSDRRNFPGGHPSRVYSIASTLNYGVPIHMSSLKRVGQLL